MREFEPPEPPLPPWRVAVAIVFLASGPTYGLRGVVGDDVAFSLFWLAMLSVSFYVQWPWFRRQADRLLRRLDLIP
jgi:hypothetical protein